MFDDENESPRQPARLVKPPLERLSVTDLGAYIEELDAEIARARREIAHKEGAKGLAESFFRPPLG